MVNQSKSNIWKYNLFMFFRELQFIIPVIVPFWLSNGLNLTQIMLLQSIFAISIVLLEVPTGVIADKFGRAKSIMLGALVITFGALVYFLGYNFFQFAVAEIIWALGSCFISGADSALIYESLKENRKQKDFKKVWGKAKSYGYFAAGAAAIIGGFIATYSLRLNWLLIFFAMMLMFIVSLTLKEPKHYKKLEDVGYFNHTITSFKEALSNKNILFLLLFYSLMITLSRISLWFYQPYMQESGLPLVYFGIVWASFSIFAILGSNFAHKIEGFLKQTGSLWFIILFMTLSLLFMSFWLVIIGIGFIFMQQLIRGFAPPVIQDYTNKHLSPQRRATLVSIQSLAGGLLFAITAPFYGYIADKTSLSTALFMTAITFLVAFIVLMIWNRNRNHNP